MRTGVTVVFPRDGDRSRRVRRPHRLNGNGEMTGLAVDARVRAADDADRDHEHPQRRRRARRPGRAPSPAPRPTSGVWRLPVVAETYDGCLNDINGFHVRAEHVRRGARAPRGRDRSRRARRRRHRE